MSVGFLKSLEKGGTHSGGGAASWTPRNMGGTPGLPSPTRPHGHSRSNAVCRGQHPLGVDEGAPAEVLPVLTIQSQAHLPGPLAARGLLPSHDVHSLQVLTWGWGRKHPQDKTQPRPTQPWASVSPPTHRGAFGVQKKGQGQDQPGLELTRGHADRAQQERQHQHQQIQHLERERLGAGPGQSLQRVGCRWSRGARDQGSVQAWGPRSCFSRSEDQWLTAR